MRPEPSGSNPRAATGLTARADKMIDLTHVRFQGCPAPRRRPRSNAAQTPRLQRRGAAQRGNPQTASVVGGLAAFVLARAGLQPAAYRHGPLERRVGACLRAVKADTEQSALERIQARPDLLGTVLSTLLIGVSEFFRDTAAFEVLRSTVVPALQRHGGELRIRSVGCSTGAELYSVAMLLAEAGLLDRAVLLGTDCRPDAVAAAARGLYSDHDLRGVHPEVRARHFEHTRCGWRVHDRLRAATAWRVADATTADTDFGQWDLVLCRNLVIYLQARTAEALLERVAAGLRPGGFLMVGKAERPPRRLGLTAVGRCVFRAAAQ